MEASIMFDLATISAVVAALVTIVGNVFNINKKYRSLLAIFFACVLWFLPREWANELLIALVIGLTASGVYSQVKPRDLEETNITKQKPNADQVVGIEKQDKKN